MADPKFLVVFVVSVKSLQQITLRLASPLYGLKCIGFLRPILKSE
jgi:hypothetical protein